MPALFTRISSVIAVLFACALLVVALSLFNHNAMITSFRPLASTSAIASTASRPLLDEQKTTASTNDVKSDDGEGNQVSEFGTTAVPDEEDNAASSSPPSSSASSSHGRGLVSRKPGKGKDLSHAGLLPDADGANRAWEPSDPHRCHGAAPVDSCVDKDAVEYFRKHILMAIISGREDSFRVDISQCTWLQHFPPENVFVFSDVVPGDPSRSTPQRWVQGDLPQGVYEQDGDVFSEHVKKGYLRAVRSAGQGYSVSWIVAQFRFPQALKYMAKAAVSGGAMEEDSNNKQKKDIHWVLVVDDDTIVNINNLVRRVRGFDDYATVPWYLSRKGWGGAGHLFSLGALNRMLEPHGDGDKKKKKNKSKSSKDEDEKDTDFVSGIDACIIKYMVKQFRASDAMLLKCAGMLKLHTHLESTMSHCPASTSSGAKLADPNQVTVHGKKDFYPPILLATWRVSLYYLAMYCHNAEALKLAVEYSGCAFGSSCKNPACTHEVDERRVKKWTELSRNGSIEVLPFPKVVSENT